MNNFRNFLIVVVAAFFLTSCHDDNPSNPEAQPPLANAGADISIISPASTVTANGTGTTSNGSITSYLWSFISGPAGSQIVTANVPSTEIIDLVPGTYLFQLSVTDNAGLSDVDTLAVTVVSSSANSVTLQPSDSPNELVMVTENTDYSDSVNTELIAEAWTSGGPFFCRSMFKFDLSSIPPSSTIISASLSLYSDPTPTNGNFIDANYGSQNAIYISRITAPWNSTTLFPNTPSTDVNSRILIPHTNNPIENIVNLDVTNLVQPMLSSDNNGFLIQLETEAVYNCRIFCSSRDVDPAKHPKLIISYQ